MFSDPPELTESTVSASKSCLSFFELKKVEEDLGFSLLKIIKLCGFTLLLLMRKTKLMSSALPYYAHQEKDLLALKIVNSGCIELFP